MFGLASHCLLCAMAFCATITQEHSGCSSTSIIQVSARTGIDSGHPETTLGGHCPPFPACACYSGIAHRWGAHDSPVLLPFPNPHSAIRNPQSGGAAAARQASARTGIDSGHPETTLGGHCPPFPACACYSGIAHRWGAHDSPVLLP